MSSLVRSVQSIDRFLSDHTQALQRPVESNVIRGRVDIVRHVVHQKTSVDTARNLCLGREKLDGKYMVLENERLHCHQLASSIPAFFIELRAFSRPSPMKLSRLAVATALIMSKERASTRCSAFPAPPARMTGSDFVFN